MKDTHPQVINVQKQRQQFTKDVLEQALKDWPGDLPEQIVLLSVDKNDKISGLFAGLDLVGALGLMTRAAFVFQTEPLDEMVDPPEPEPDSG